MKLYSVSDGPPSLACRQLLKILDIKYELIDVDYGKGEHMTEDYEKVFVNKIIVESRSVEINVANIL